MITTPTLLVDEQKCRANIKRMVQKAINHDLELRPHFKTHQSADIGEWFKDEGVTGITVSSVSMADYFARHGWKDITIAFPVNLRETDRINSLADKVELTLLISDIDSLDELANKLENSVSIFIEIDTGSNRSGFKVTDHSNIDKLLESLRDSPNFIFKGFYSHPGHSYSSNSEQEILKVHKDVLAQISQLRSRYDSSIGNYSICIGDTPCCSVAEDFSHINQVSPGNFAFYDMMQAQIGSCDINDIAVVLACPVVAKYPSKNEVIIYGGAVHLSKDRLISDSSTHYGIPVSLTDHGWEIMDGENGYVKSLSQEHGVLKCSSDFMRTTNIGDLVGILPVHSCLCADLMSGYQSLSGEKLNHIRNRIY